MISYYLFYFYLTPSKEFFRKNSLRSYIMEPEFLLGGF